MTRWTGPVVATIDMLLALFVVAVALIVQPAAKTDAQDKAICKMAIDLQWDGNGTADIDLWAKGPGTNPVGWDKKDSPIMSLVKDDRGKSNDTSKDNSERICAKDLPDGEYVVNVDVFNPRAEPMPIRVLGQVALIDPASAFMTPILKFDEMLHEKKQEKTVLRFSLKGGQLVFGSVSVIPERLARP